MLRWTNGRSAATPRLAIACVLALTGGLAQAQTSPESAPLPPPDISGLLRFDYFSTSQSLDDRHNYPGLTGELQLVQTLSDTQRLNFKIQSGAYTSDDHNGAFSRTRLIDGYWFSQGETVDLRVGQQQVRWGRADGINPTDFFTPHDYTVYLPLEEDQRLSIPAIRADVHVREDGDLSLVAEPNFTATRLPQPSDSPIALDRTPPSNAALHPQLGIRYSQTGETFDWSLDAFHGYSTLPLTHVEAVAPFVTFQQNYPKIFGLGGDVAHNFGQFGFRAELAYIHPYAEPLGGDIAPYYFLVSGVDRSFDNWNVNVQAVVNYSPGSAAFQRSDDPLVQAAIQQNLALYAQVHRIEAGATARISANWLHDTLQTELLLYGNGDPWNYFIRPLVTYAVNDQWKVLFGGEYYGGSPLGFFGLLKKNRTLFFEARRYF